jgi:hypothetical protein
VARKVFDTKTTKHMTPKDTNDLRQLLTLFSVELHQNSRAKGWWADRDELSKTPAGHVAVDIGCLALAGTELAEAIEATRVPCQDYHIPFYTGQEAEIADTIIRLLDFAAARNLRVVDAMIAKAEYNKARTYRHGGKLA